MIMNALRWLAVSPIASALKIGIAASLTWILSNPDYLHLSPVLSVAISACLPVIINWLNPADDRYGFGSGDGS